MNENIEHHQRRLDLTPEVRRKLTVAGVSSHVVYGPMACGKTRSAKALAVRLGYDVILDDWDGRAPIPPKGVLVFTSDLEAAEKATAPWSEFSEVMANLMQQDTDPA